MKSSKMGNVRTILGDISPENLGLTAMHEHILMFDDEELVLEELVNFRKEGGSTLVEVTTLGLINIQDRDEHAKVLAYLSSECGINIVAGTGFYKEPKLPPFIEEWDVKKLADYLIKEILVGIGETDFQAGIIGEVGSSNYQIFPTEAKVLQSAAIAQLATGVAITTHTGRATKAHEQLDIFESEGVDLGRVVIGHLDVQPHLWPLLSYYEEIANRGVSLQFDTVGKEGFFELHLDPAYGQKFPYDKERAEVVAELISRGYLGQILVSCDVDTLELTGRHGGGSYKRLLSFREDLKEVGLKTEHISTILVHNPRKVLTF